MPNIFVDFRRYPASVQKGLVLLLVGWGWFFVSLYGFYLKEQTPDKMLIVGAAIAFLALSMKNWARMLCLLCNAMAILWCLGFAVLFFGQNQALFLVSVVNVLLFSLATFYLAVKPSAEDADHRCLEA